MTYYPLPDIPANADPQLRRFCEQVRSLVGKLEGFGLPFEVHEPITEAPGFTVDTLDEFPVYRADVPVELLYATWTVPFSESVKHDLVIGRRDGSGATATATDIAKIEANSVGMTDWVNYRPKRFAETKNGRRLTEGQLLTLTITEITAGGTEPWGLLSMYFRRAEAN